MSASEQISRIRAANIKHVLKVPIHYGEWVMRHREFVLVQVELSSGQVGHAYGLTREGPVREIIERSIANSYLGKSIDDPEAAFYSALWSNHAVHAAGIGMRALSLVDLATWDALAHVKGQSIGDLIAPGHVARDLPATAIVGYPPSTSPEETAEMVLGLQAQGWRRFKIPISPDVELSIARLEAVRKAAPEVWLGFDINMVMRTAEEVLAFEKRVRHLSLGWIEDLVPPGDPHAVAAVRTGGVTPVAMGDEQGGSYYPQSLLDAHAVDFLRVDATTNGGLTGLRKVVAQARAAGVAIAPHMFPHTHARLMSALGIDAPVEWGVPGTGVHPMDDGLERPVIENGLMKPMSNDVGFGQLVDLPWILQQEIDDPSGLVHDVESVVAS